MAEAVANRGLFVMKWNITLLIWLAMGFVYANLRTESGCTQGSKQAGKKKKNTSFGTAWFKPHAAL